jgi:Lanthionine synthetase C-like protein
MHRMLFQSDRHELLSPIPWNESIARGGIERIVRDTEQRYSPDSYWPWHPKDLEPSEGPVQPALPLYFGAAGVVWALRYLPGVGAIEQPSRCNVDLDLLMQANRAWLSAMPSDETASFLLGDTPILLMALDEQPSKSRTNQLAALVERNLDHPARELMWGSPGTMLAALFQHERSGDERWAELVRRTAAQLWSQLEWSEEVGCHYWTQDLYGRRSTYLDAVHGFVATAFVLIRSRHLLDADDWRKWEEVIAQTIERTATREDGMTNWRVQLLDPKYPRPHLMQFCHGSPGFVICLAGFPTASLDELLVEAGEATWAAGPLIKGSNLCHGTGGNGYAFLKLYERTGNSLWLDRARAFAMHGIAQLEAEQRTHGQLRYSLWTGDLGFAIYLWDCIRARAAFPTLDVFYPH